MSHKTSTACHDDIYEIYTTTFVYRRAGARLLGPARAQAGLLVYYIMQIVSKSEFFDTGKSFNAHYRHITRGQMVLIASLSPLIGSVLSTDPLWGSDGHPCVV